MDQATKSGQKSYCRVCVKSLGLKCIIDLRWEVTDTSKRECSHQQFIFIFNCYMPGSWNDFFILGITMNSSVWLDMR
jgi:hypothetical protein